MTDESPATGKVEQKERDWGALFEECAEQAERARLAEIERDEARYNERRIGIACDRLAEQRDKARRERDAEREKRERAEAEVERLKGEMQSMRDDFNEFQFGERKLMDRAEAALTAADEVIAAARLIDPNREGRTRSEEWIAFAEKDVAYRAKRNGEEG